MSFTDCYKEAKLRLRISDLWRRLNLPGEPKRSCKSPFRDERRPSFSIYLKMDGDHWKDHGTGESGDVFDFYERATGLSKEDARKELFQIAGVTPTPDVRTLKHHRREPPSVVATPPKNVRDNVLDNKIIHDAELLRFLGKKGIQVSVFDRMVKDGYIEIESNRLVFVYNTGRKMRCSWEDSHLNRWVSGSAENALWRYHELANPRADTVFMTEGETDLMRALSVYDFPDNVALVAIPAASWVPSVNMAHMIAHGRRVILAFDNDAAGLKCTGNCYMAMREHGKVETFPWSTVRQEDWSYDTGKDLSDMREESLKKILELCLGIS